MILGSKKLEDFYFSDLPDLSSFYPYKISSIRVYFTKSAIEGIKVSYYSFRAK
jgi:hypothetical protein